MSFGNPFENEPQDLEIVQTVLLRMLQIFVFMLALLILILVSYAPISI